MAVYSVTNHSKYSAQLSILTAYMCNLLKSGVFWRICFFLCWQTL